MKKGETAKDVYYTTERFNKKTEDIDLNIPEPESYGNSDNYFIYPEKEGLGKDVVMGPNIKPFPIAVPLTETIDKKVILKIFCSKLLLFILGTKKCF